MVNSGTGVIDDLTAYLIGWTDTLSDAALTFLQETAYLTYDYLAEKKEIVLNLTIDEDICTMYEYFEIFLGRMMMSRGAAELLGVKFRLYANGSKVL